MVTCVLLLMCAVTSTHAQNFEVGGNLSLNTRWILNQNASQLLEAVCPEDPLIIGSEPGYAITPGISIGGTAAYDSERFWGVAAELNYNQRGQNYKDNWVNNGCGIGDINNFKRKFTLHYFEVPLMMKFLSNSRKKVSGYGELGVQFGFRFGGKEKVTIDGEDANISLFAIKDKVKKIDLGLVFGGGVNIELNSNLYLSTGLRGYFGFLDINNGDAAIFISENDNAYQSSRNFSLGLNFGVHYVFDWIGGMYR